MSHISKFIEHNYRHFNAATLVDASKAYKAHLQKGGKMMLAMGGAMSTGELGISLAEMIRKNKIHAITCTGANLEEDIFNLVAHNHYRRVPHYRQLSPADEVKLLNKGLNRVTDTCIPEHHAMRAIEKHMVELWSRADRNGERYFPYEFIYQLIREKRITNPHIPLKDSWVLAACEKNLPIFTPGWEDSTLGNFFTSHIIKGNVKSPLTMKSGIEQMLVLIDWYLKTTKKTSVGFFQIGGGIAGDFPICVVPLIEQDLRIKCKLWGYFCQISDSTTSYGSYSGAVPNEKITWGKLSKDTPRFVIESDATIVAPLIFSYVLGH